MKTCNASKVGRFSAGSTAAILAGLLWLVAADVRGDSFFRTNTLPPDGQYRTSPGSATTYPNGVSVVNLIYSQFTATYVPPALGSNQVQSFSATMNFMVSLDDGGTYNCIAAPADVMVRVTHTADNGGTQAFDTEMLMLNLSGGGLPPGMMVRESPTLASTGQTTLRSVPDGYMIDSFFDVFTELSTDSGQTWTPARSAMGLNLAGNVVNTVPSANMPSDSGQYRNNHNAPCSPLTFLNGMQIRNIREYNFSTSYAPPALGAAEVQFRNSTVAFEFSADGGTTFSPIAAPATVTVKVNHTTNADTTQIFDTEMLQLDISGGGVILRESPTLPSKGRTTLQPDGGGYQVSSFFDVFTELSLDGGQTWNPASRAERLDLTAPCLRIVCPSNLTVTAANQVGATVSFSVTAEELCDSSFVTTASPPSGSTFPIGSTLVSCTASNALGQIATCSFVVTVQPPLEVDYFPHSLARVTLKYPNGATEVVSLAGPTTVHVTIPPDGAALDLDADGRDQVSTEMVQLDLHGGSSLGPVTVRLNPAQPTLGEIEEQANNTPDTLDTPPFTATGVADSFFDVFFEVEAGGQTLRGAEAARMQTVISHKPPAIGETYTNRPIFTLSPQCLAPDNGQGTAWLPATCCAYTSSNDTMHIIDGLPPGTTMELTPTNRDFACLPGGLPPGECFVTDDHTPTNGESLQYTSTLQFGLHGTGALAGYNRNLTIPGVQCAVTNAPRLPGTPVQSFDTEMMQMQGQLPPGDPDFDLLRITAGTSFGLPSPGHTTLTQQPGGDWAVDSFFDITYRIDFVGAPGGPLAGHSGSTTATIRMSTGNVCSNTVQGIELLTTNGQPTGIWLMQETHTPNPAIEVDTFNCTLAQFKLQLPGGQYEVMNLSGPATVHVFIPPNGAAADTDGDGRDQVPTEMVALNLTGLSPLGPVTVRLATNQPSLGEMEEQANNTPGTLDVRPFTATGSIDSFFDVFFEVQLGTQTLHGATPAHLMALLTHKPPAEGETYGNANLQPIPLLAATGQPTGILLIQAAHTPNPVRPRLEVALLPNQQVQICWPELPPCFRLQSKQTLHPAVLWEDVRTSPQATNGNSCVTLDATTEAEYFRLIQN